MQELIALKRTMRYLLGTKSLVMRHKVDYQKEFMETEVDADWAVSGLLAGRVRVPERPRVCSCVLSSLNRACESNASTCPQTRLLPKQ